MPISVLLVDDAVAVREAIRAMLDDPAYVIVGEASNGVEAVDRFRDLSPDLVVMDLVMPHMNGVDAARAMLAVDPNARIIAISGLSQPSVMAEAERAGIRGFLPKPVDRWEIEREIREVMRSG